MVRITWVEGGLKKQLRPEAHPQRFSFSGSGVGEEDSSGHLPSRDSEPFQRETGDQITPVLLLEKKHVSSAVGISNLLEEWEKKG